MADPASPPASSGFARGDVVVLGVTMALMVAMMTLIVPVIPDYAEYFDVGLTAAASMVSVFAAGRLVFRFWGGIGADRFGARPAATAAAALVTLGAAGAALAPQFWMVLAARAIQGVGVAVFGVAANQHLLIITPRSHLGRATAIFQTGIVAGAAAGPLLGGVLADLGDLRTPFWAQVAMGLAIIPAARRTMGDAVAVPRTVRASLRTAGALVRTPVFAGVMVMGFSLFFMRAGARNALLPAYADAVGGLSASAIGLVVGVSSVTSVAAMIPTGRLVDRLGRKPVVLLGAVAASASVALYGTTSGLWGLVGVSALAGLTVGLASVPLSTIVGDLAPSGAEGIAAGVFRMANDGGWIVGPLVLGALGEAGAWGLGFIVAGLPLVIGGLLFVRAPETGPSRRGPPRTG
jgi:MFS family permease